MMVAGLLNLHCMDGSNICDPAMGWFLRHPKKEKKKVKVFLFCGRIIRAINFYLVRWLMVSGPAYMQLIVRLKTNHSHQRLKNLHEITFLEPEPKNRITISVNKSIIWGGN